MKTNFPCRDIVYASIIATLATGWYSSEETRRSQMASVQDWKALNETIVALQKRIDDRELQLKELISQLEVELSVKPARSDSPNPSK